MRVHLSIDRGYRPSVIAPVCFCIVCSQHVRCCAYWRHRLLTRTSSSVARSVWCRVQVGRAAERSRSVSERGIARRYRALDDGLVDERDAHTRPGAGAAGCGREEEGDEEEAPGRRAAHECASQRRHTISNTFRWSGLIVDNTWRVLQVYHRSVYQVFRCSLHRHFGEGELSRVSCRRRHEFSRSHTTRVYHVTRTCDRRIIQYPLSLGLDFLAFRKRRPLYLATGTSPNITFSLPRLL